jgi:hypothetical protein
LKYFCTQLVPVLAAVQYSALKKRSESPKKFGLSFFIHCRPT